MGEVIEFPNGTACSTPLLDDTALTPAEIKRLEAIRDNVEALLNMVAGILGQVRIDADVPPSWPRRDHGICQPLHRNGRNRQGP